MYDQIREDIFYIMLYAIVTALAMLASCYLLFRQGNAFAKDVTPPRVMPLPKTLRRQYVCAAGLQPSLLP